MPYPNEHAARIKEAGGYKQVRRQNDKLGPGIDAIFGIKDGKSEIISIRFDKKKFTPAQARQWLKDHDFKAKMFEQATDKENKALVEIDLIITKANIDEDGNLRWQTTASDTIPDRLGEQTSQALFQDWIERVEKGLVTSFLPSPRKPFLGVSHYPDLDGYGEAGITDKMYIDGQQFKAGGVFFTDESHPLGPVLFAAVSQEREFIKKGGEIEQPIRISAAWWDLQHSHGDFIFTRRSLADKCPMCQQGAGDKQYLKGQLDHFASTRVPINPRTELQLEEKSMTKTRKDDAETIVGPELAEELDKRAKLVGKSETEDEETPAMVIKADDEDEAETGDEIEVEQAETEDEAEVEKGKPFPGAAAPFKKGGGRKKDDGEEDDGEDTGKKKTKKMKKADVEQAALKDSEGRTAGDYLIVEDPKEVTTWHLAVKTNGKPDPDLMGGAAAALGPKGHRGKKYNGPRKAEAKRKLIAMYKELDKPLPPSLTGKSEVSGPEIIINVPDDFDPSVLTEDVLKALSEAGLIEQWGEVAEDRPPRPFGGATDLKEAEAFLETREKMDKMYDNWGMFQSVMSNIMSMVPEEGELESDVNTRKLAAMSAAIGEFGDRIDSLKAGLADAYLIQPITGDIETPVVELSERSQIMADETPQNDIYAVLKAQVEGAMENSELDQEKKAEVIQKAIEGYVGGVKNRLYAGSPADIAGLVSGEIKKAMGPLAEQVALIAEKLNGQAQPQGQQQQPVQKSLQPSAVGGPAPSNFGQPMSIHDVARRSVGLPQ